MLSAPLRCKLCTPTPCPTPRPTHISASALKAPALAHSSGSEPLSSFCGRLSSSSFGRATELPQLAGSVEVSVLLSSRSVARLGSRLVPLGAGGSGPVSRLFARSLRTKAGQAGMLCETRRVCPQNVHAVQFASKPTTCMP